MYRNKLKIYVKLIYIIDTNFNNDYLYKKNDFIQMFKNLARYKFENNFVKSSR